jgi:hypothetical protein
MEVSLLLEEEEILSYWEVGRAGVRCSGIFMLNVNILVFSMAIYSSLSTSSL